MWHTTLKTTFHLLLRVHIYKHKKKQKNKKTKKQKKTLFLFILLNSKLILVMSLITNKDNMSYTNATNDSTYYIEKKQLKRRQKKWTRIIKQWGHDNLALNELYNEGDDRHGTGFKAFLNNIIVHRDIIETVSQRPQETGIFDILETIQEETNTSSPKKMSFADIMKEQALNSKG